MRAQKIAQKLLDNKEHEKTYRHTVRVVKLCEDFVRGLPVKAQADILYAAAWLHDAGKTVDDANHYKRKVIRKTLKPYEDDLEFDMNDLVEIIHAHKKKFNPPSGYELESAVLRLCDKIDRYNKGKSDAPNKCKDSKEILKRILGKEKWKAFKKAYWGILAETIKGALNNPALDLDDATRELFQEKFEKAQKNS